MIELGNQRSDSAAHKAPSFVSSNQNDPLEGPEVGAGAGSYQGAEEFAKGPVMEEDASNAERNIQAGHQQVGQGHVDQERVRDATQATVTDHHVTDEQVTEQRHGHDQSVGTGDDHHLQRQSVIGADILRHERCQIGHCPVVVAAAPLGRVGLRSHSLQDVENALTEISRRAQEVVVFHCVSGCDSGTSDLFVLPSTITSTSFAPLMNGELFHLHLLRLLLLPPTLPLDWFDNVKFD